jgi:hypothetical protein
MAISRPSDLIQRCSRQDRTSALIFLEGVLADRGQERGELHPVLAPCPPWPEREPGEGERRVHVRAAPVTVLAVHDLRLARMKFQAGIGHPPAQRGQDLAVLRA